MTQYLLPNHVFVCLNGDHVVFLDVRADKYLSIKAAQANALAAHVRGWPVLGEPPKRTGEPQSASGEKLLGRLLERKLLTMSPEVGKAATPVAVVVPTDTLTGDNYEGQPNIRLGDILNFLKASLVATFLLKFTSLERVVTRVHRRNRVNASPSGLTSPECGRLIAAFFRLRPILFTSRDQCLFESFALSEFLSRHGVYPKWVFAVQADPFFAHCWLQLENTVLNDSIEDVRAMTPILEI